MATRSTDPKVKQFLMNMYLVDKLDVDEIREYYGVLGMRWGVRKDRSTGKRQGTPIKGTKKAKRKNSRSRVQKKAPSSKPSKKPTIEEMQKVIADARVEAEYRRIVNNPSLKQKAAKEVKGLLTNVARTQTNRALNNIVQSRVDAFLKKQGLMPEKKNK